MVDFSKLRHRSDGAAPKADTLSPSNIMATKSKAVPGAPIPTTDAAAPRDELAAFFGRNAEADAPAPIIEREHLKAGAIVRHKSSRTVQVNGRSSFVHSFQLLGAPKGTPWFSLWGSANLNSQLRKLPMRNALFLRYLGQLRNDDGTAGAHQWEVRPSTVSDNVLARYLESAPRAQLIRELATECDRALEVDRERRRAERNESPAGPPHDDDDLPF